MSFWVQLDCKITYDLAISQPEIMAFLDHDDFPRGSEGPAQFSWLPNGNAINIQVYGSLRDRGSDGDIDEFRQWFKRIVELPAVSRAFLEIQVGDRFCCAFYYADNVYTEIAAPPGFVHQPIDYS